MSAAPVTCTRAGVWRGFVLAQPLAPGVLVYALVFGALAGERGLSWLHAVLMSVFVYSGSAQLAALQVWSTQSGAVAALAVTVLAINARYVLYGAAIQPWLSQAPRPVVYGSLFVLGDGSWALAMREHAAGYRDAGFILGSGLAGFFPWVGGTIAGQLMANAIPDPRSWGLDFMLPAFAAAIGYSLWRGKADVLPLLAALAVAVPLQLAAPSGWTFVLAGIAVAAMAAASYACRVAGYLLMGWLPITPRLEAGLRAMPIGVMAGIVTPSVVAGRPAEIVGLAVVFLLMRVTGKDVVASLGGAFAVALVRVFMGTS